MEKQVLNYKFNFVPLSLEYLNQIKTWTYTGHVKSIYCKPYFDSYKKENQFRGPGGCIGFAALLDEKLAGLFECYSNEDDMEIGLALAPDLVGKGLGIHFVKQGIEFLIEKFNYNKTYLKLSVDVSNKAAIRVYEKVGFILDTQNENELNMKYYLIK